VFILLSWVLKGEIARAHRLEGRKNTNEIGAAAAVAGRITDEATAPLIVADNQWGFNRRRTSV
jgi:hypothetical protein